MNDYSVDEIRDVIENHRMDPYHKELMKWMFSRLEDQADKDGRFPDSHYYRANPFDNWPKPEPLDANRIREIRDDQLRHGLAIIRMQHEKERQEADALPESCKPKGIEFWLNREPEQPTIVEEKK